MLSRFHRIPKRNGQTDGQTELLYQYRQEAQLSQRDHVTLRVIEYFAKSFTITQGHSQ